MHHVLHPVPITLLLLGTAMVYVRGWIRIRRSLPNLIPVSRLAAFLGGLALLWIAVASPLAGMDHELLIAHMLQHLLIMTVAAPLLLLGARRLVGGGLWFHPAICWLAGTIVVLVWHIPEVFERGMSSEVWHATEQGSFLAAGLLFWWPIMQPWPGVARLPRWSAPLYLFLATLPCDALSAFLTFCDRVVYPSYMSAHRLFDLSAIEDQQWAGTLMWVWVTFAYLAPAASITMGLLSPRLNATVQGSGRAEDAGLFGLR
jgi:cytochrome c oxidase assembly factor CtaG